MKALITFLACAFASALFSQSNINQTLSVNSSGATADASAQLDVSSTTKGMLVPRMTTAERTAIASPATGLLVFDVTTGGFWFYGGTTWTNLSTPKTLQDADGDTKIQVEESPDEDIIRFDLGGTENMVLRKNASGITRLELPTTIENTFVGQSAGAANTSGSANTAAGREALLLNTTGFNNTALGGSAMRSNISGNYNTAVGEDAMFANSTGTFNTAVGEDVLRSNTSGSVNSALGESALFSNTSGHSNVAIGAYSLYRNTIKSNLVAVGDSALYNNGIGAFQGFHANYNTAIGSKALFANTFGAQNTAIGYQALLSNTEGSSNVGIGYWVLKDNTTGEDNIALGYEAMLNNTTGDNNIAIGNMALIINSTGNENLAMGQIALLNNSSGNNNIALGTSALQLNATGSNNIGLGASALFDNTTGGNNTAIGNMATVSLGSLNNATALGSGTTVNASNKVRIGNTAVTVIEGQVDWTFPSDARFKFNIHDDAVPGLAFIEKLRPVTYQFDTRKFDQHLMQNMPDSIQQRRMAGQDYSKSTARVQTGFLAQEVEQACKDLGFEFSGLHVPESEVDNYGLAYGSFVPLLVKAIQELKMENGELSKGLLLEKNENAALKAKQDAQAAQLDKITAALAAIGVELR